MKLCDMCPAGSTEKVDTYRVRFDCLPPRGFIPEREIFWCGELCDRHAAGVRAALKLGPPSESDNARSPGLVSIEKDAARLDAIANDIADALESCEPCTPTWMHGTSERLQMIAARMRDRQ